MEFIVNVGDYPQSNIHGPLIPTFSFSKDSNFQDIMYPAWAFWKGGPCTSTEKGCLGRWDLKRVSMPKKASKWDDTRRISFFRGSRTSAERDPLVKLGIEHPDKIEAKYTKNQAWRSLADSMGMEPQGEIPLEDHCVYRYQWNFRGVAASFRHRHLFLCNSVVLHVGEEWLEFYYPLMKPWVHYVPIKTDFSDAMTHLDFVMENDDIAREISERGKEFILNHLRMEDIVFYWFHLLREYAKLMTWKVEKMPDLIVVKENSSDYAP